jgi:glycosidase
MKNILFSIVFTIQIFIISVNLFSQNDIKITRIDPPSWWTNIKYNHVQLMVYGENLSDANVSFNNTGILVDQIHYPSNSHYLFVDISIKHEAKPGNYNLICKNDNKKTTIFSFELKKHLDSSASNKGLSSSDVIYLLMPDRFSNGNPNNDSKPGMLEIANRLDPNGRHGGDIKGIVNHLGYIRDMGFTALWITPLLENNMQSYSYHGYAITDLYKIDPRFGINSDYRNLVDSAHKKGLKVIMDMVFNHCGTNNRFIGDLPDSDWVHQWPSFTRSNYRGEVNTDPYASDYDKTKMEKGWFDVTMADLNQDNPFVYSYLLQNSIWWIEYAGIDGIRMDTYPYPQKNKMADWAKTIRELYPDFWIVGETWLREPSHTAYWQEHKNNYDGFNSFLPSVTDFPTYFALKDALNQEDGWTEGLSKFYYVLSQDFLYSNPQNLLIFPDNHDLNRFYTDVYEDFNKFRMGMVYILTTRGIPQIYYGTEILMTGDKALSDGFIRKDFPGGWASDTINAFTGKGLDSIEVEAQEYFKKLLNWRKNTPVIHTGKFKQFIPEKGIYVYFRYNESSAVMVILNKNNKEVKLETSRFNEVLKQYHSAKDIINDKSITNFNEITLAPVSPLILELEK